MQRLKRQVRLRTCLLVVFTLLNVLSVSIVSLNSIANISRVYEEKRLAISESLCKQVRDNLQINIDTLNERFTGIENSVALTEFDDYIAQPGLLRNVMAEYFPWTSQKDLNIISLEFYFRAGGEPILVNTAAPTVENPFASEDIYYHTALDVATSLCWVGYRKDTETIDAVKLLYDPLTYETLGYFLIKLNERYFLSTYSNYQLSEIDNLLIVDSNDNIISSKNNRLNGTRLDPVHDVDFMYFSIVETVQVQDEYLSGVTLTRFRHLPTWRIIVVTPRVFILKELEPTRNAIVLLSALCFFVCIVAASVFSRYFVRPLKRLIDGFERLENENFEEAAVYDGLIQEVGHLFGSFNRMQSRFHQLINENYKQKLLRQEAQLQALKRQINPHFLFNTLDMINWKARTGEEDAVYNIIKSLSYMLNVSIDRDGNDIYTVAEELEYLRHYTYILLEHYGDRLEVHYDIPDALLGYHIPKLILQPLMENAVKHGVMRQTTFCSIHISMAHKGDTLVLQVRDNGTGIPAAEIERLYNLFAKDRAGGGQADEAPGYATALRNIAKRLDLHYQQRGRLVIESEVTGYTTVAIHIPASNA